ncbi:hypothetical protein AB6N24_15340 [Cellulomonas sp. 179-A 4D5 NHS]|uniref:hypothetical protein n=1 Tax=Cellulomonas sp. 179-A 4D5 NHS TaxID=3142378 RepID=UPI00399EEE80
MQQVVVGAVVPPTTEVLELLGGEPVVLAGPDDLDGMWTAVADGTTHLLLLGEDRHETLVRRHAALVSDRGVAVSWLTLPHGPAALVVLALQAASVSLDAGLLPEFVRQLAARTWSGAWTPSVSKLVDPAPSVGQHLRSWTPGGSGFVVTLSGDRGVVPVGGKGLVPGDGSGGSLYCAGSGVPDQARDHLVAASGASDLVEIDALRLDPEARFGHARAVEVVALPSDERVPLPPASTLAGCVVCAAVVPGEFCSYCHVRPAGLPVDPQGVTL